MDTIASLKRKTIQAGYFGRIKISQVTFCTTIANMRQHIPNPIFAKQSVRGPQIIGPDNIVYDVIAPIPSEVHNSMHTYT